jgi:mono/diheme cytochrome c family protein
MRTRATLLVSVIGVALVVAACGRASEDEINRALGITPSPTRSAADLATATASAVAGAATRTAAALVASSPGASGSPGAVAAGDIAAGTRQFTTWCAECHRPGGRGPDILAPGSAAAGITVEEIMPLLREGTGGHPSYRTFELSNKAIADLVAYIQSKAGGQ